MKLTGNHRDKSLYRWGKKKHNTYQRKLSSKQAAYETKISGLGNANLIRQISNFEESRDHLLLLCDYSAQIWRLVMARLSPNQQTFRGWEDLFHWLNAHLSGAPSTLKKIVAQSAIYHIWKQRNNVLFNQLSVPPGIIFSTIDREIKNSISARRQRKRYRNLMTLWIR